MLRPPRSISRSVRYRRLPPSRTTRGSKGNSRSLLLHPLPPGCLDPTFPLRETVTTPTRYLVHACSPSRWAQLSVVDRLLRRPSSGAATQRWRQQAIACTVAHAPDGRADGMQSRKRAFYLYVIIKVRNDLRAIEILKSFSVPSSEVFFIYVPLSLVFLVTARGKDDFALSYRMHQNFHSFLRCHCNIL